MLCCTVGVLTASGAIGPWVRKSPVASHIVAATSVLGIAATVAVSIHIGHYVQRAELNGRTLLQEIAAQPICTGGLARYE